MSQSKGTMIEQYQLVDASTLPDGVYRGHWGGYQVTVTINETVYKITTEDGIRTPSAPCVVSINKGNIKVWTG